MFGWVFKFSKALQGFLSWDRLPLLNIKEGSVLYEMKYLVIPKAMNPSRNSHCKTDQIMRNTFLFPPTGTKRKEKRRCGLCSEQLGYWKCIVHQNTGQKEWAKASSPCAQSQQVGQMVGGFLPHQRGSQTKVWETRYKQQLRKEGLLGKIASLKSCREASGLLPRAGWGPQLLETLLAAWIHYERVHNDPQCP